MIVDESATIPSDWREDLESLIADPEAEKPSDWDDEMDGEWEAPLISESLNFCTPSFIFKESFNFQTTPSAMVCRDVASGLNHRSRILRTKESGRHQ